MRQIPAPGSRTLVAAGSFLHVRLFVPDIDAPGRAFVRGNFSSGEWRDYPMEKVSGAYALSVRLDETGVFSFKACFAGEGKAAMDWPDGADTTVKVAPAWTKRGCSIYTAFVRQFKDGETGGASDESIRSLDALGYTVIPPSGTFRNLIGKLDHIIGDLGFHIIQLLPIHPVPTVYGRMGRYGSPYASLDFFSVDPALVEFDKSASPLDQFCELADAVHHRGARLFLDIPANHTGWASVLQNRRPEWFKRNSDGSFRSPGAWGVVWEDLVELDYSSEEAARAIADVFLFWAAKGADGFRCDAGYMVPEKVWTAVTGTVKRVFPDCVFLLEGLGGKIETTEELLFRGGMDWAYSEIFQVPDRDALQRYLPQAVCLSEQIGPLVNFAETHDNNRLASRSFTYARLRTALAALLSGQGAFGITAGAEWFATEKIDVHGAPSLNWGAGENQIGLVSRLNAILDVSEAFSMDASVRLVTKGGGNVLAALRSVPEPEGCLLAVFNLDCGNAACVEWDSGNFAPQSAWNLITLEPARIVSREDSSSICLPPGGFAALTPSAKCVSDVRQCERLRKERRAHPFETRPLPGGRVSPIPFRFPEDCNREIMVPPHCLMPISSKEPFRVLLSECGRERRPVAFAASVFNGGMHRALLAVPAATGSDAARYALSYTGFGAGVAKSRSTVISLPEADAAAFSLSASGDRARAGEDLYAVLANRRGAMSQVKAKFGEISSQYDAFLAVNPEKGVPADKTVFFARPRVWLRRGGYSFEIDKTFLVSFDAISNRAARWRFAVPVGTGRKVEIAATLALAENANAATLSFLRTPSDDDVPAELVLRPDVEARSFHCTTLAYQGAERDFPNAVNGRNGGFSFAPPSAPALAMESDAIFSRDPKWTYSVPHPVEAERGLAPTGDLFSPGWFSAPFPPGGRIDFRAGTEEDISLAPATLPPVEAGEAHVTVDGWLRRSPISLFIADRDGLKTVIAGYPWFLDWGRDTFIVLRGLVASGKIQLCLSVLRQFAKFEEGGTLPNIIHGNSVGNRDTSDAPLWFVAVVAEAAEKAGIGAILEPGPGGSPSLAGVCESIVEGYLGGTPNGIRVDMASGLVYSPAHYTWMDTNYPMGTPRAGYPVEIEALWIHALSFLREKLNVHKYRWIEDAARLSLLGLYPMREGWLADSLRVEGGGFAPAAAAVPEDALRPNQLLAVALGAVHADSPAAKAIVEATSSLLVPGAIRSLAPRPVSVPQPVEHAGRLLNDPCNPYWGRYSGDEDTRRKPAYHNGTAWAWQFPMWCEAYAMVMGDGARDVARSILASSAILLSTGVLGHIPEIQDGDAPHAQKGCKAQAWSLSEFERVWIKLRDA